MGENPEIISKGYLSLSFAYVHSEKDILKLVTTLMTNTKGEGSGGDPFWEKSERLLLTALIAYLHYEAPVEEQNFATLLEMLNTMQVLEDDEEYQNPVDLLFEELAKKKPNSFAGRQYKLYKLAAGKTAKSILISCGARLAPFDIQELRDLTMYDELQLDTLGDKKTALFLIMSDTDSTFNFLIHNVRVRSIRPCSFPLKWRYGLTNFPIGTPRPQTNVSASLHCFVLDSASWDIAPVSRLNMCVLWKSWIAINRNERRNVNARSRNRYFQVKKCSSHLKPRRINAHKSF